MSESQPVVRGANASSGMDNQASTYSSGVTNVTD